MDTFCHQLNMVMEDSGPGFEVDPSAESGLTVQMGDQFLNGLASSQCDLSIPFSGPFPVVNVKPASRRDVNRNAAKLIYTSFLKAHVCKLAGAKLGSAELEKGLKALQKHIGQASKLCGIRPCRQLRGRWSWPENADMKNPHNSYADFTPAFSKNFWMPMEMTENNLIDSFLEQLQDCRCSMLSEPDWGVLRSRPGTDAGAVGIGGPSTGIAQQEPQNPHLQSLAEVLFSDDVSGELSEGDQEEEAGQENPLGRFPNAPFLIGEVNSTQVRRSRTRGVPRENTAGGAAQDTPDPAGSLEEAARPYAVIGFRREAERSRDSLPGDVLDTNLRRIVCLLVKEAALRERLRIQFLFLQLDSVAEPDRKREFASHILHHTDRQWNPQEQRIEDGAAPSRRLLGVDDADLDSVISWSLVHCRGDRDAVHVLEHQLQRPVGPAQCILYSVGCGVIDALRGPLGHIGGSPGGGPGGGGGTDSGENGGSNGLPSGSHGTESGSNKRLRDSVGEQAGNGVNGTAGQGWNSRQLQVVDKGEPGSASSLRRTDKLLALEVEGESSRALQRGSPPQERAVAEDNFPSGSLAWGRESAGETRVPLGKETGEDAKATTGNGQLRRVCTLLEPLGHVDIHPLVAGMVESFKKMKGLLSVGERVEDHRMMLRDTEAWMEHRQLPPDLRKRVRQFDCFNWGAMHGVDEEKLLEALPEDLSCDIKRRLCLDLVKKVPQFERLDNLVLDAICEQLKPQVFVRGSCIIRQGDPVFRMLFITRGTLQTLVDSVTVASGDFVGDELLTWCLDPRPKLCYPPSPRTVVADSQVEAFSLSADDLRDVTDHFLRNKHHMALRCCSPQWRTWGALVIQAAWRQKKERRRNETRYALGSEFLAESTKQFMYILEDMLTRHLKEARAEAEACDISDDENRSERARSNKSFHASGTRDLDVGRAVTRMALRIASPTENFSGEGRTLEQRWGRDGLERQVAADPFNPFVVPDKKLSFIRFPFGNNASSEDDLSLSPK